MKTLLFAALLCPVLAFADAETDKINNDFTNSEKQMTTLYNAILKKISTGAHHDDTFGMTNAISHLKTNQEHWAKYADSYCSLQDQGTIFRMTYPLCMTNMTKNRIKELKATDCTAEQGSSFCLTTKN